MLKTKVLIVGGGPAGSTAGRFLSSKGIDNILVQKNLEYRKPCGGGIRLDAFDKFDLDRGLVYKTVKKIGIGYKDKKITVDIKENPLGIVDRKIFDSYLRNLAVKNGTELVEGSFLDFSFENGKILSTVKTKRGFINIESDYLIAADGVNSIIRKKMFGSYGNRISVEYTDIHGKTIDECDFYFGKDIAYRYYAWVFPHFDGINIGTFKGKLDTFLNFLGIGDKTFVKKGFFIPIWDENEPFFEKNIFFVGDSGGQVLPFTFEGIYYAIYSGKIVAEVISSGESPKEYEKRWKDMFYKKFYSLKKLQNIFLRNDFSITALMRLFESEYVQKEMVKLWLGKRDIEIDIKFFIRVLKKIVGGKH